MKKFDYFVEKGVVKKRLPDLARADSLVKEASRKSEFLKTVLTKIGICDENANDVIESCHDIIMNLIRVKMFREGFFASGFSAHEAEVSFLEKFDFSGEEIYFVDKLRYFRNGMLYYGKKFDKEYAMRVLSFLEKVQEKLK